mgnify:CR=1 FL=1
MDHVSDNFIKTNVPLYCLIEAAVSGKQNDVKLYAKVFRDHAGKLGEVAKLACSMSSKEEGKRMVMIAIDQLETLCPQVINAAFILGSRPDSKVAQDNMFVFRDSWIKQVNILTDAVDEITTIGDFLAVSEQHILEDITACVTALQASNADELDQYAGKITGRVKRVCAVVEAEMDNYEPDMNTEHCKELAISLREKIMPIFSERVEHIWELLDSGQIKEVDDILTNEFVEASRMVYDGINDIRRAVIQIRKNDDQDVDDDDMDDENGSQVQSHSTMSVGNKTLNSSMNQQRIMRNLPAEDKELINKEIDDFKKEKTAFVKNVECYEDHSYEIIVLAKKMCLIMMQMTDFTRGTGPLKTTNDVIQAAQIIAQHGRELNDLAQKIAQA